MSYFNDDYNNGNNGNNVNNEKEEIILKILILLCFVIVLWALSNDFSCLM